MQRRDGFGWQWWLLFGLLLLHAWHSDRRATRLELWQARQIEAEQKAAAGELHSRIKAAR